MSTPGAASSQSPLIPPGFGGVPLPPAIPAPVQRAFLTWIIVIGLGVVNTIVGIGSGSSSAASVVVSLLFAAAGVYLALHFRGGRNWARIVLTVLTALALLFYVIGLFASLFALVVFPVIGIVLLLICAVGIAAGVFMLVNAWKAESTAYFARFS